jgi:hypothetical protein
VEYVIIQFSRLRLVNDLPCLIEALQGEQAVGEIFVGTTLSGARRWLAGTISVAFLVLSLPKHVAQIELCSISRG